MGTFSGAKWQDRSVNYPHLSSVGLQMRKIKVKESHNRPGQTQRVLRKLRFPDFVTTAQNGGRLSALHTDRLYPQEILLVLISVRGWFDPRAIVWSEGSYGNEKFTDTSWDWTSVLSHCATAVPACRWVGIINLSHFCAYMGMSWGDLYIYQSKISRVYYDTNMQT